MNTLSEVLAKCRIDNVTRCWVWHGAGAKDGVVHIHAIDHARKTKRTMSGPTAVWNIAHGEAPPAGYVPYRWCGNRLCVNPVHLRLARGQAEVMHRMACSGRLKGTHLEQRRAAARRGHAAQGMRITPDEVVRQILAAQGNNCAVARRYGVHHSVVSRIRLGQTHKALRGDGHEVVINATPAATRRAPARDQRA